jgi:glycosyltransferase involved in cell wall biosynthesis
VKDGDIEGLANALMHLMNDNDLRQKMGETARLVVDRYSEEKVMSKWQKLYEEILC